MNILINAYAVSPNHGSEPGVGWNWTIEIAKYCNVHVITEAEFKNEIELALRNLPQKDNIHFYFNDIGEKARKMCWNQGDYRFYYYYKKWQKRTYEIALGIIKNNKIDIIHQLNMIGYREPGYLWNIKEIPFVWGPIGGFNFVKTSFLSSLGLKNAIFYTLKNLANTVQAITNPRVRKSINRANLLLAASGNTQKSIERFFKKESIILNETGCHINDNTSKNDYNNNGVFNIVWVGRFIPTKLLYLALDAIKKVEHLENLKFHIVGSGVNDNVTNSYKEYANSLGIDNICVWHDKVSREKVDEIMTNSHLLFFSSIIEGTSHVILESIANNLPILCFDSCGHGEIVTEVIGRKIPVTNPKQSTDSFAKEIGNLYSNRLLLQQMSENCNSRIIDLSWKTKGKRMFKLYNNLINK
ncbi:MAG: glycosyltransferase [Desulfuromonadaceae bacterium]|nr:glycosyltransferase [Desulfuromonadaceae bacterium]